MRTLNISLFPEYVCKEHGIYDTFPCPWPGCKNGFEDECFQVQGYIEGQKVTTYKRRAWQSPLGGTYYNWEGDDLPNWFSVPKTFWNEARRLKLITMDLPSLIYHYTTLEGFVGIVQSRSMWLSDYSFLNDKHELMHGTEIIREVIAEMLEARPNSRIADLLHYWDQEIAEPNHRVCIASFSAENDSLSQWRAYGTIAIGINPRHLPVHAHQTRLQPVEYDHDIQRKLSTVYLYHMTQMYEADLSEDRLERIPDVYHQTDRFVELAAFFKDPAFRTEQEYRLAYIENSEVLNSLNVSAPPKRFRISKSRLQPYLASDELFPIKNQHRPLEIEEVILGPEADELFERGIREFLDSCEMADVSVRRSRVPYRT